nr:muscleblind protein [Hymenolepis microstoma]
MQPTQALATGLWTGGINSSTTPAALTQQPNIMFPSTTNDQILAMLAANARNTEPVTTSLYTNSVYSTGLTNPSFLLSGYPFNSAMTSPTAVSTNGYNPAEFLAPIFSTPTGTGLTPAATSPVHYNPSTVALMNAIRQAAAANSLTLPQQSGPPTTAHLVPPTQPPLSNFNGVSNSRKRAANNDNDTHGTTPAKRSNTTVEDANSVSNTVSQAAATAVTSTSQIANTLAWLQHQQQATHPAQLVPQQQTHLPSPPTTIPLTPTTSPAMAIQTATLLRLQQQAAQQLIQQQQAQQNWAALFAPYGLNPLAFYDQFTGRLAMGSLTGSLPQNQALITSCPYFTEDGHLIESLQLCRDFQAGKCHRNSECRYVHIADTKGLEVNQGRVTVCRDAAKGRCSRQPCRYYHIPLQAISVNRSHALNSVLSTAAASMNNLSSSVNTSSVISTSPCTTVTQAPALPASLTASISNSTSLNGSSFNHSTLISQSQTQSQSPTGQSPAPAKSTSA